MTQVPRGRRPAPTFQESPVFVCQEKYKDCTLNKRSHPSFPFGELDKAPMPGVWAQVPPGDGLLLAPSPVRF